MVRPFNAVQDARIHGPHDFGDGQRTPVAFGQTIQCGLRLGIKVLGSFDFETNEFAQLRVVIALQELSLAVPEMGEIFSRKVDAALLSIRAEVAQNIRELKCHAEIDCVVLSVADVGPKTCRQINPTIEATR